MLLWLSGMLFIHVFSQHCTRNSNKCKEIPSWIITVRDMIYFLHFQQKSLFFLFIFFVVGGLLWLWEPLFILIMRGPTLAIEGAPALRASLQAGTISLGIFFFSAKRFERQIAVPEKNSDKNCRVQGRPRGPNPRPIARNGPLNSFIPSLFSLIQIV